MYFLYFLLLFNFSWCSGETPQILIEWRAISKQAYGSSVTKSILVRGQNFVLAVRPMYGVKILPQITCYLERENRLKKLEYQCIENKNSCTVIVKATSEMSTKWYCASIINNKEFHTYKFDVKVRLPYSAILQINGKLQEFRHSPTDSFDKFAIYNYVDGEMPRIKCTRKNATKIEIIYHDTDQQIKVPQMKMSSILDLKLNSARNGSFLDCILTDGDECSGGVCYLYNILRVYFLLSRSEHPTFKINDLVLKTDVDNESKDIVYRYDYFENERVLLGTLIDRSYSDLKCTSTNKTIPDQLLELVQKPKIIPELSLQLRLDQQFNSFRLICELHPVHNTRGFEHNKVTRISLDFKQIEYVSSSRPFVSGFSPANVLATYYEEKGDAKIIQYSYRENELVLICRANDNGIKWSFNNDQVFSNTLEYSWNSSIRARVLKQFFKLKPNCNRTVISCFRENQGNYTIELIRGQLLFEDETESSPETTLKYDKTTKVEVLTTETTTDIPVTNKPYNNKDKVNPKPDANKGIKDNVVQFKKGDQVVSFNGIVDTVVFENNQDSNRKTPKVERRPDDNESITVVVPNGTNAVSVTSDENIKPDTDKKPGTDLWPNIPDVKPQSKGQRNGDDDDGQEENDIAWKHIAIILGIIIIIVIVTLIGFCLFKLYKKGKQERRDQGIIDYENLPEHNEGPMPLPKQWDTNDITYATPHQNKIDLYAKPIPKNKRKNDNLYSEIIHYQPEPTYANAGKDKDSNVCKNNTKITLDYANLATLNNGDAYAQVVPKSQRISKVEYKNICVSNKDCVEPAYAEIGKQ